MKETISVIMPAFNAAKTINASIQSVLSQTYTDYKLYIIDDCSTDNTVEVINSFNDPRIVLSNACNQGVTKSTEIGNLCSKR